MKHLTEADFLSTMGEPMQRAPLDSAPPFDFWDYFGDIPDVDFEGQDCSSRSVEYVWNDPSGRYQHVLVDSTQKNVFMVLVLDLRHCTVFGHRLLDLDREYGLEAT